MRPRRARRASFSRENPGGDSTVRPHLIQSRAHARSDALIQRIFACWGNQFAVPNALLRLFPWRDYRSSSSVNNSGCGFRDKRRFSTSRRCRAPSPKACLRRDQSRTRISTVRIGFQNFHLRGFARRIVARLNFLQQLAIITKTIPHVRDGSILSATQTARCVFPTPEGPMNSNPFSDEPG